MLLCLLLHVGFYVYWATVRTGKQIPGVKNAK